MKRIKLFDRNVFICSIFGIIFVLLSFGAAHSTDEDSTHPQSNQIALMPFLIGKLESPHNSIDKPLSQPLSQLLRGIQSVKEGGDFAMTTFVHGELKNRFSDRVFPIQASRAVFEKIKADQTLDTPRKLALKFGTELGVNRVLIGTLWRFQEKGADVDASFSPASVAFNLYLIDVSNGNRLWRQTFEGSQKAQTQDGVSGLKPIKMGLRWVSVEEVAKYGIKQVFQKFPDF